MAANRLRFLLRRWVPLLYLLPLAYLLGPLLWEPLDDRFYNYFHAKRSVEPWTEVIVVGIDRLTRDTVFPAPAYPLSRHASEHARLVGTLTRAGARAIVLDLGLGADNFARPPFELVDSLRSSGIVRLVMSMEEARTRSVTGRKERLLGAHMPHPSLVAAAAGTFVADVETDPDGVVRRLTRDPRLDRLELETLPEGLSGCRVERPVPIVFPSTNAPLPSVSYRDILREEPAALDMIAGRIAFVGLVEDPSQDFVTAPRRQQLDDGADVFDLSGVAVLAAMTETLLRGGPLRDATAMPTLGWNLLWCLIAVTVLTRRPVRDALILLAVILLALAATGIVYVTWGRVFPAGLLLGTLLVSGGHGVISSYVTTAKRRHVEELERERMRQEMESARRTQERFLPKTLPELSGVDVWGINVSSLAVSGDYYDVIPAAKRNALVLTIADVSGKGLPAALLMSDVQAGLHCHALFGDFDLCRTVENLNRLVHENADAGSFVTLFLADLDVDTGQLRYVRAGHDPPILVSAGGNVERLTDGGLVLGLMPEAGYDEKSRTLQPGDLLCLYTDGVTEARNQSDDEFAAERLERLLKENRHRRASEIGATLLEAVESFTQRSHQADDLTLVILKVLQAS